jgi:seryl-tRNA synthetase
MLDPKFIRENPEKVKENMKKRGLDFKPVQEFLEKDKRLRDLKQQVDELRHKRNVISEEINKSKKEGKEKEAKKKIEEAKSLPEKLVKIEEEMTRLESDIRKLLLSIPNMLAKDVPSGKSEEDNKVLKKIGSKKFAFKTKDHLELALALDLIDPERAAKVSGNGFFYLKEELALLDLAIQRFAIDFLRKKGYKFIIPPFMLRKEPYEGVTCPDAFENMLYKIDKAELYLIATAEHALASMFMNETLNENELPLKFVGLSPCFRKEIGSHGKYTKGLFRMHQFYKVEQFIFCKPEDSWKYFEELQNNSEELYKEIGLPCRIVVLCSADTGFVSAKTYDMEVLMADGEYREAGSCSNCLDYQARRLNIKYREKEGQAAKDFVHTLNNTALATSRIMLAILENYQQKDGSILIPEVLQKYTGFKKIEAKKQEEKSEREKNKR